MRDKIIEVGYNCIVRSFITSYPSLNIIRMIESRRMRWVWHVAWMEKRGMHTGFWCESKGERDQ
jgi:hypothetical protein